MRTFFHYVAWSFAFLMLIGIGGAIGIGVILWRYATDLPDYTQLANYEPAIMTRVHAGDGQLITEYARENRMFVPIDAIPMRVVQAFVSAEDQNFFEHSGVDGLGVVRAAVTNVRNAFDGRRLVGASTITQQVAKNFLLSGDVLLSRKIKEAILAFRIERAFTKAQILELYLNEIYLGRASYGVAAAALNYFDKPLADLTLVEAAYLAALPKAPNNYHPVRNYDKALARRNYVIERMRDDGYVSPLDARLAMAQPLEVAPNRSNDFVAADYFAEDVRRELEAQYGEDALYEGGLSVRTSLDPTLQKIAARVLRDGLLAYDRRHGWHGLIGRIVVDDASWVEQLASVPQPAGLGDWQMAVVLRVSEAQAIIGLPDGRQGVVPVADMRWARQQRNTDTFGPSITDARKRLQPGDVVAVAAAKGKQDGAAKAGLPVWSLQQLPEIDGALVAMDPHTGRVLAMQGGYDFKRSQFNRATQAQRQPGSAFKPVVYAAALENGFTPSSLILDAPFVIDQGAGLGLWKPGNYSGKFYGPSTLRLGIEKSRNLMTVRLAQYIGMPQVLDYANRFGIGRGMRPILSMSLGAGEVTLLELTTAYAMLVNGGRKITPTLIDRVQDRRGRTIYRHDNRPCVECRAAWAGQLQPELPDLRQQAIEQTTAYQLVSMLEGVIQRGTGRSIAVVGKPLAGKTGTTNDSRDTWFIGFSPDLVVGVFVGFDNPRTLGNKETGSSVAAPIFRDFFAQALKGKPPIPFRIPDGIRLVRVNSRTGLAARPGDEDVILEAFRTDDAVPTGKIVLDGQDQFQDLGSAVAVGSGGLY